jgi:hypothetical protein
LHASGERERRTGRAREIRRENERHRESKGARREREISGGTERACEQTKERGALGGGVERKRVRKRERESPDDIKYI